MRLLALIGAFIVGGTTAAQARANGELAGFAGSGIEAAVISFGTGFIILSTMALASGKVRAGMGRVIDGFRAGSYPRWQILGGVMGGFFVGVQTSAVPVIGVALFTIAVVAGQSVNSLVVDRMGLGPAGVVYVSPVRVISALLAVVGVSVAVSGRLDGTELQILPIVLALIAGAVIAVQQATNGRMGLISKNPFSAAWFNFTFGTTALAVTGGILIMQGNATAQSPQGAPWWSYTGGALGVIFIATSVWVVPRIGVLVFALTSISGQLSGALILDIFAPTEGTKLGAPLFIGIGLTFAAVALSTLPRLLKTRSR